MAVEKDSIPFASTGDGGSVSSGRAINRGNAKRRLKRHNDAIADYDEAIRLKPDYVGAYINRGNTKGKLGFKEEARKDFETALELARNTNNAKIVTQAEKSLRDLDDAGDS